MLGCYIPRASWVLKQGGMEAGCPDAGPFPFASCWALGLRPGSKVLSPDLNSARTHGTLGKSKACAPVLAHVRSREHARACLLS